MAGNSGPDDRKRRVAASFDAIAANYDALRFVRACAGRLLELADLEAGERVLDVGTGTGLVAVVAAEVVGPGGRVVGVDLSPQMLARAREKLAAAGLAHLEFKEGDAERLEWADESFDAVLFASSLFFVPDMLAALREARRVLVRGGRVGFSGFGATFHQPLRELWAARLRQHGLMSPPPPTERLADPAACEALLREAGFAGVEMRSEQLGYFLPGPEERWAELEASLEGVLLARLEPALRDQIRAEHLAELEGLATPQGIWVDVAANFASGRRN